MIEAAPVAEVTLSSRDGTGRRVLSAVRGEVSRWLVTCTGSFQAVSQTLASSSVVATLSPQVNKLGSYYCFNRTYDVLQGRWTSPDPATNPWTNLFSYSSSAPATRNDKSGLEAGDVEEVGTGKIDKKWAESKGYDVNDGCGKFKLKSQVVEAARGIAGAEARYWVKVEYIPHESNPVLPWCCTCDSIRLVQFVRTVHNGEGVANGENGTVAGELLKSKDDAERAIGKRLQGLGGKSGWGVDLPGDAFEGLKDDELPSPWYKGMEGTDWAPQTGYRKLNSSKSAFIYDSPILPLDQRDGTYSQEFQTCAVCDDGGTKYSGMTVLGCLNWRVRHLAERPDGKDTRQVVEITGASDEMGSDQAGAIGNYDQ